MTRVLYAHPVFRRGQGFGNRLFPWARARVFAKVNGARLLAPHWARLAVGPLRRGGVSLRAYREQFLLLGLFRPREDDVTGWRRALVARRATGQGEPEDPRRPLDPSAGATGETCVRFEGYRGFFGPLLGWSTFLNDELRAVARPSQLRRVERLPDVPIAVNVRAGNDFRSADAGARRIAPGQKTPLPWFVEVLRLVRRAAGGDAPAYVVSDGTPAQLAALLAEPSVTLVRPGGALSDLLTLARARVLLASGSSSFSAWGAFLGGGPAASHPGQPLTEWRLPGDGTEGPVRREVDPQEPDAGFLEAARRALAPRGA